MLNALAINLNELMKKYPINEAELSRKTTISQPVINRILKGVTTNPNIETLRPIAKFFKVPIGSLIGEEPLLITTGKNLSKNLSDKMEWTDVPILNWEMDRQIKEKDNFIRLSNKLSSDAFALIIEDITMEPTFLKGTCIIVEPELTPIDQDHVIIMLEGQKKALFRQILYSGDKIFFKPLNKDFGTIQTEKNFKIIGVTIEAHLYLKKISNND